MLNFHLSTQAILDDEESSSMRKVWKLKTNKLGGCNFWVLKADMISSKYD